MRDSEETGIGSLNYTLASPALLTAFRRYCAALDGNNVRRRYAKLTDELNFIIRIDEIHDLCDAREDDELIWQHTSSLYTDFLAPAPDTGRSPLSGRDIYVIRHALHHMTLDPLKRVLDIGITDQIYLKLFRKLSRVHDEFWLSRLE